MDGVGPLVRRNVAFPAEAHGARGAGVGFLAGVRPLVLGNGALVAEAP